jgi:hypothetical protein
VCVLGWSSACSMPATCRARAVGSLGSSGCCATRRTTHLRVGYLTYLTGFQAILSRDLQTAAVDLGRSVQIAERCGDLDLSTLAQLALGRVRIFRGDVSGGVGLLDEVMVAVNAGGLRRSWSATATAPPSTRAMTCSTYVAARYGHPAPRKGSSPDSNSHAPAMASSQNPLYVPPPDLKNAMSHTPHAPPEVAWVGLTAPAACTPFGWM